MLLALSKRYTIKRMEPETAESLKKQLQLQKALEKQKLKELDLIRTNIEVLELQLKRKDLQEKLFQRKSSRKLVKKKWYVVFNGSFPGIYDDWHKAAPHCTKISRVWHESHSTKEEAEKKFKEFQETKRLKKGTEIYLDPRTFSETIKNQPEPKTSMKILGRIPFSLDDCPITSRKEHELQVQFSKEMFFENLKRLTNWIEKEKNNCYYMVNQNISGIKAIITPGAPSILAFNMFQFRLIKCLYLSKDLEEISLFPYSFKEAVQMYKKYLAKERTIFLKFYSAYPDLVTRQLAKHLVFFGVSNNSFSLRDEPIGEVYDEDQITIILANQLASIFTQCQIIGKDSFIKVLYKGPYALLLSKTSAKIIKEKHLTLLTNFELPFYTLQGPAMKYCPGSPAVLNQLCSTIKQNGNHKCERCTTRKDPSKDNNDCRQEDKDSDEAIIEE